MMPGVRVVNENLMVTVLDGRRKGRSILADELSRLTYFCYGDLADSIPIPTV